MKLDASAPLKNIAQELASLVLELDLISAEQFSIAQRHSKETQEDVYDVLLADGLFDESVFIQKLSERYGLSVIENISIASVDEKFPKKYCIQNFLLPITSSDNPSQFIIGIAGPSSLNSLKNLSVLVGKKAQAIFIPLTVLRGGIRSFETPGSISTKITQQPVNLASTNYVDADADNSITPAAASVKDAKLSKTQNIPSKQAAKDSLGSSDKKAVKNLSGDVITGVNEIFDMAIEQKVSDIHIEQHKDIARIRFRRNGAMYLPNEFQGFVTKNLPAIISRIKIIAGLDIAERRLPQDGGANYVSIRNKTDVDLRISIIPTSFGERAVLRILNKASLSLDIDALGFSDQQKIVFKKNIESPQGLVLVTGPTGSGKSTTLYGAINYLNKEDVNILTAEDPVEYSINGIGQVQIRDDIGLTFASALRSFLRQDPEIILVGEIRDAETADIATKAALTGHLVLSTLHTNSAVGAITRLINMGLPRYLVSNALSCVVAQRLLRVNCPHCSRPYRPSEIEDVAQYPLFDANLRMQLKRGDGCANCNQSGFISRKAVHEVLDISFSIKSLINKDASEQEIIATAQKEGFAAMIDRAKDYIYSGQTTIEEVLRTIPMDAT
jgi:type IV pilus assembly protein PilB